MDSTINTVDINNLASVMGSTNIRSPSPSLTHPSTTPTPTSLPYQSSTGPVTGWTNPATNDDGGGAMGSTTPLLSTPNGMSPSILGTIPSGPLSGPSSGLPSAPLVAASSQAHHLQQQQPQQPQQQQFRSTTPHNRQQQPQQQQHHPHNQHQQQAQPQQQNRHHRLFPVPNRSVDPDRLLLFLIIDYLKRRGYLLSVQNLLNEARIDPMASDTAETVQLMEALNGSWGRNPHFPTAATMTFSDGGANSIGGGFLKDWWSAFWATCQSKSTMGMGSNRNANSMAGNSPPLTTNFPPSPVPPSLSSSSSSVLHNNTTTTTTLPPTTLFNKKAMLGAAMQSVGLSGRDPRTLNVEEQRAVSLALHQLQQVQIQHLQRLGSNAGPALPLGSQLSSMVPVAPAPTLGIMKSPEVGGGTNVGSGGGATSASTPNTRKRKVMPTTSSHAILPTEASNLAANNMMNGPGIAGSTVSGNLLTPQQMLQLRAAQMQQQQQQLQLQQLQQLYQLQQSSQPNVANPTSGSRIILPGSMPQMGPVPIAWGMTRPPSLGGMGSNATGNSTSSGFYHNSPIPIGTTPLAPGPITSLAVPMTRPNGRPNSNPLVLPTTVTTTSSPSSSPASSSPAATSSMVSPSPITNTNLTNINESALLSFFGNPQEWFALDEEAAITHEDDAHLDVNAPDELGITKGEDSLSSLIGTTTQQPQDYLPDPADLLLMTEGTETPPPTTIRTTESGFTLVPLATLGQHEVGHKAASASFSADGRWLASGGHDKRVLLFDVSKKKLAGSLEGIHTQQVTQVRFSPIGCILACSSFDRTITLWNLSEDYNDTGYEGETDANAGDRVRGKSAKKSLFSMSLPSAPVAILRGVHEEPIWSLDFVQTRNKSGKMTLLLASIDSAGKMAIWDVERAELIYQHRLPAHEEQAITIRHVRARPLRRDKASFDWAAIISITDGSLVQFFDCERLEFVASLAVNKTTTTDTTKPVVALNWDSQEDNLLITATNDTVSIWDTTALFETLELSIMKEQASTSTEIAINKTARLVASYSVPADKLTCCSLLTAVNGMKKSLAIFGGYQSIYLWEYEKGSIDHDEDRATTNVAISSSERRPRVIKFSGCHDGLVVSLPATRYNFEEQEKTETRQVRPSFASASHDGWIKLWEVSHIMSNDGKMDVIIGEQSVGGLTSTLNDDNNDGGDTTAVIIDDNRQHYDHFGPNNVDNQSSSFIL